MKNIKKIMSRVLLLSAVILLTSNVMVMATDMELENINEKEIIGEFQALDEFGNPIEDIDAFLSERASGRMTTGTTRNYYLEDSGLVLGTFRSGAYWRADYNRNVTSYGSSGTTCRVGSGGTWADYRTRGYKTNNSTARLTITGEASNTRSNLYDAMDHVYYLYGNGSYDMDIYR